MDILWSEARKTAQNAGWSEALELKSADLHHSQRDKSVRNALETV